MTRLLSLQGDGQWNDHQARLKSVREEAEQAERRRRFIELSEREAAQRRADLISSEEYKERRRRDAAMRTAEEFLDAQLSVPASVRQNLLEEIARRMRM